MHRPIGNRRSGREGTNHAVACLVEQEVVAGVTAGHDIATLTPGQHIGPGIAKQNIVEGRPREILDRVVAVSRRMPGIAGRGSEIGPNSSRGMLIARGIETRPPIERVAQTPAFQSVIAAKPVQRVNESTPADILSSSRA